MKRLAWLLFIAPAAWGQIVSTTTVTASTLNPAYRADVTFTITVTPSAATGTVQLWNSTRTKEDTATLSGGTATIVVHGVSTPPYNQTLLAGGAHSMFAVYLGDGTYFGSTSNPITVTNQPISTVELINTITANQAANGLGFNVDPQNDWEFQAMQDAGAKWARIGPSWSAVGQQSAPPLNNPGSPAFVMDANSAKAYVSAAARGIHITANASYGPPNHQILAVSVPSGASIGAYTFTVQFATGFGGTTISNLQALYDYLAPTTNTPGHGFTYVTQYHSGPGSLIAAVTPVDSTHASVTLAAPLTSTLPADGTLYQINEELYPATLTTSASDASVIQYGLYAQFLASYAAAHGVTGDVELWNEPVWNPYPWDNRCALYDPASATYPCPGTPGPSNRGTANYGFAAYLQGTTPPAGIGYTWNGTSASGSASLLGPQMLANTGVTLTQPASVVSRESAHPYGNNPEENLYTEACLEATAPLYPANPASNTQPCMLPGISPSSNYAFGVQYSLVAKLTNPSYGIGHSITETGIVPPTAGLQTQQARFIIRQFIGLEAVNATPVEFFKLWDGNVSADPSFSFVTPIGAGPSYTAKPNFTAMKGFMQDIAPISSLPVAAYPSNTLPSVASYTGTYPLATVHMVGSRAGASANSDDFVVWQRSNTASVWIQMASPAAAPVRVAIPAGLTVTSVTNLTTRAAVSFTASGSNITFNVADDPVGILVDPPITPTTGRVLLGGRVTVKSKVKVL